jgi:hypothetical protein
MAGLFSRSNSTDEDRAAAIAISAPMRLTLGKLTPAQRLEVLYRIGYCFYCAADLKKPSGRISPCSCWDE